jgi:hypothetical protein
MNTTCESCGHPATGTLTFPDGETFTICDACTPTEVAA